MPHARAQREGGAYGSAPGQAAHSPIELPSTHTRMRLASEIGLATPSSPHTISHTSPVWLPTHGTRGCAKPGGGCKLGQLAAPHERGIPVHSPDTHLRLVLPFLGTRPEPQRVLHTSPWAWPEHPLSLTPCAGARAGHSLGAQRSG